MNLIDYHTIIAIIRDEFHSVYWDWLSYLLTTENVYYVSISFSAKYKLYKTYGKTKETYTLAR